MRETDTIHLLVGRGKPVWLEFVGKIPPAIIHRSLARNGMVASEEEAKLIARIEAAATEKEVKEVVALARAYNDRQLAEWPNVPRDPTKLL